MVLDWNNAENWTTFDLEEWAAINKPFEFDPQRPPSPDVTPLEVLELETACRKGFMPVVVDIVQQWRQTPQNDRSYHLEFASSLDSAMRGNHTEIATYLINNGITPHWPNFDEAMKERSYPFLEMYLEHGFNINQPQDLFNHFDPPRLANTFEDGSLMQWFLDHGADPNAESENNVTPLSMAVRYAPLPVITKLFDIGGPSSIEHGDLLHFAADRDSPDRVEVLDLLLSRGMLPQINNLMYHDRPRLMEQENWVIGAKTPVHLAANSGKLDIVKYLVMRGANVMIPDGKGRLAIDEAQKAGFDDIVKYLSSLPARAVL